MKTTLIMRSLANPRRTTLAHSEGAEAPAPAAVPQPVTGGAEDGLPVRTANPRRTVLVEDAPGR